MNATSAAWLSAGSVLVPLRFGVAVTCTVSPKFNRPRLMAVWSTEAGTVAVHDWPLMTMLSPDTARFGPVAFSVKGMLLWSLVTEFVQSVA